MSYHQIEKNMDQGVSDSELLEGITKHNKAAFEKLFYRYHQRVFQFVLRMVKQPDMVDEVVNDVMYVIWDKAASFGGRSTVSTWIFGIAYRKTLKSLEKSKKYRGTDSLDVGIELADTNPEINPEHSYKDKEFLAKLSMGLDKLSAEQRGVVELTALGHSYGDIAEIMECPENTVKTRMFHARKRLRELAVNA